MVTWHPLSTLKAACCLLIFQVGSLNAAVPGKARDFIIQANRAYSEQRRDDAMKAIEAYLKIIGDGDYPGESKHVEYLAVAAQVCHGSGEPAKGLKLAQRGLVASKALNPMNHHVTGMAHTSATICHISLKSPKEARAQATQAWENLGKVLYKESVPNLIPRCHSMVRIAGSFLASGDSLMAEKFYQLAVDDAHALMKITPQGASYDLGKFSAAGRALSSLGGFYSQAGDHRRAIPLILYSLEVRKNVAASSLPSQSSDLEGSFIGLSRSYLGVGESVRAKRYGYNALESSLRSIHIQRQTVANSTLASAYSYEGEYDKALEFTEKTQELMRTMRNDPKHESPSLLNNTGWLYCLKGDFKKAKSILTKAYQLFIKDPEQEAELGANILFTLAMVEFMENNPDRAILGVKKAHQIYEEELTRKLNFGSDSQKLAFLQKLHNKTGFVLGMSLEKYPTHAELTREAWLTVMRRKGRMTRLLRDSTTALNESRVLPQERDALAKARAKLSLLGLSLGIFDRQAASEFDQSWMIEIEEAQRVIDERLSRSSRSKAPSALSLEKLAGALEDGEVLLEYAVYQPFRREVPKAKISTIPLRCGVFAMDASGKIQGADLGEYDEIQRMAIEFRASLANGRDSDYQRLGKELYQKLLSPLEGIVAQAEKLRIAPDGQLSVIPFEALIAQDGSFLGSASQISYLINGSELLQPKTPVKNPGKMQIFAGPAYSLDLVRKSATSRAQGFDPRLADFWEQISSAGALLQFQALPGTITESEAIAQLIPQAEITTGAKAKEAAFAKAAGGGILHLATHGFYLNDSLISIQEKRGLKRVKPRPVQGLKEKTKEEKGNWIGKRSLDHPLLNCGLVFSGANQLYDGSDDGVMTGMEVLNLDLRGTDLIVLSACETGVGEVIAGEGVLGLNQAFRVAGASSLVTSLWKVSDAATAALMTEFYTGLKQGLTKREALQKASAKIRETEKWQHPSYWAAFILSGEAGALAK